MTQRYVDPNSGSAAQPGGQAAAARPDPGPQPVSVDLRKDELLAIAKEEGVEHYSSLNKDELAEAINAKRGL